MKIYLAGPMRGYPDHNYPLFNEVAAKWRALGFDVVNPAENFGGDQSLPWAMYMRQDIAQLATCDAIALLPGYRSSEGARRELLIAQTIGLGVFDAMAMNPFAPVRIQPVFDDELEALSDEIAALSVDGEIARAVRRWYEGERE